MSVTSVSTISAGEWSNIILRYRIEGTLFKCKGFENFKVLGKACLGKGYLGG